MKIALCNEALQPLPFAARAAVHHHVIAVAAPALATAEAVAQLGEGHRCGRRAQQRDAFARRDPSRERPKQIVATAQGLKPQARAPWEGMMHANMRLQPMIVGYISDVGCKARPRCHAGGFACSSRTATAVSCFRLSAMRCADFAPT